MKQYLESISILLDLHWQVWEIVLKGTTIEGKGKGEVRKGNWSCALIEFGKNLGKSGEVES